MEILESIKAHAPWRPCAYLKCVSGLHRLEKLTFSWCIQVLDLVLKCCSDKKARNGINFTFHSLCWWRQMHGLLAWVFSSCGLGFRLHFFHNAFFFEKFAILLQKWIDHEWRESGHLLFNCASFRRRHICMDWNQQEVGIFVSPPWTLSLFDE